MNATRHNSCVVLVVIIVVLLGRRIYDVKHSEKFFVVSNNVTGLRLVPEQEIPVGLTNWSWNWQTDRYIDFINVVSKIYCFIYFTDHSF